MYYNLVISLTHDTTWSNTTEEWCAQTLSDARLSPRVWGGRTSHEETTQLVRATGSCMRRRALVSAPESLFGRLVR
jgi:hypothetical protein